MATTNKKRRFSSTQNEGPSPNRGSSTPTQLILPDSRKQRKDANTSAPPRIARACDRCQTRKLACTRNPKGCEHCAKAGHWCTNTEGIPERLFYRGEFDFLERSFKNHLRILAAYRTELKLRGLDRLPCDVEEPGTDKYKKFQLSRKKHKLDFVDYELETEEETFIDQHSPPMDLTNMESVKQEPVDGLPTPESSSSPISPISESLLLPDLRQGLPHGSNFLGLTSKDGANRDLQLHAMGLHISLPDLMEPDLDAMNESLAANKKSVRNRTYKSAMATMFHDQPPIRELRLPSAAGLLDGYMAMVNPFYPLIVKSRLATLLHQYTNDKDFKATPAQEVIVHTVAACMSFQSALRSQGEPATLKAAHLTSNEHFHYALGFYGKICAGNTIDDMLALALLCVHTRSFPKPDLGLWFAGTTFKQLLALGYHRKTDQAVTELSDYEHDMRKRIFHTVLHLHVVACARTGTPMPIRFADIDIEIPETLPESAYVGDNIQNDAEGPCEYLPGLKLFRLTPILISIYNGLYGSQVNPSSYAEFIDKTDTLLKQWRQFEPTLKIQTQQLSAAEVVQQHWLETAYFEAQLLLHHPSLSLSKAQDVNAQNLKACTEASRGLYITATNLLRINSLDITWYSCALYLLAISTGLYAFWQQSEPMSPERFNHASAMYQGWAGILEYIGKLLGSNAKFSETVQKHIHASFQIVKTKQEELRQAAGFQAVNTMQAETSVGGFDGTMSRQGSQIHTPSVYGHQEPMLSMGHPPLLTHATSSFSQQAHAGSMSPTAGLPYRGPLSMPPGYGHGPGPTSMPSFPTSAPMPSAAYPGWQGQYFPVQFQGPANEAMLNHAALQMADNNLYSAHGNSNVVFTEQSWGRFVQDTNEGLQNPVLDQNYNAATALLNMNTEGTVDTASYTHQQEVLHWPHHLMPNFQPNGAGPAATSGNTAPSTGNMTPYGFNGQASSDDQHN